MLTIDQMIEQLEKARKESKLGGDTVVHICLQEVPYIPVAEVKTVNDQDGAVVILKPSWEPDYPVADTELGEVVSIRRVDPEPE